ncbi:hypothetical protein K7X08_024459 [Anisodus acutangulus]|uniref:Uncharacterized protein n=1 Tax=Anisodus acutangulus TaxID=402998 RepID=A0A9Q1MB57_9SOLA|nr:hypothetical protein K7X08_024459 [Anisodus acutangulus]
MPSPYYVLRGGIIFVTLRMQSHGGITDVSGCKCGSLLFGSKPDAVVLGHPCGDDWFKICGALASSNGAASATHRIGIRVKPTSQESNLNPLFKYVCGILLTDSISLDLVLSDSLHKNMLIDEEAHICLEYYFLSTSVLVAYELQDDLHHFGLQVQNSYGDIYVVWSCFQHYGAFSYLQEARTTGLLPLSIYQFHEIPTLRTRLS